MKKQTIMIKPGQMYISRSNVNKNHTAYIVISLTKKFIDGNIFIALLMSHNLISEKTTFTKLHCAVNDKNAFFDSEYWNVIEIDDMQCK